MSHRILIECDDPDCINDFEERQATSASMARIKAQTEGWMTTRTRPPRDYCPEHALQHNDGTPQ